MQLLISLSAAPKLAASPLSPLGAFYAGSAVAATHTPHMTQCTHVLVVDMRELEGETMHTCLTRENTWLPQPVGLHHAI
jgi:hypothetical protein